MGGCSRESSSEQSPSGGGTFLESRISMRTAPATEMNVDFAQRGIVIGSGGPVSHAVSWNQVTSQ